MDLPLISGQLSSGKNVLRRCKSSRVFLALVWAVIIVFEIGCAAAPLVKWPPVDTAREFGTVAVIPAQAPPGSNFYVFEPLMKP